VLLAQLESEDGMTTKLEFIFRASKTTEGDKRDWNTESNILPASEWTDPGATPDTKLAELNLAVKFQTIVLELMQYIEEQDGEE
jgi:hypothetical protein